MTDPKLALIKGKELWAQLSQDEPENQARPENLEQLLVLLTREATRRVVHFVNFTSNILGKIPKRASNSVVGMMGKVVQLADLALKVSV